MYVRAAIKKYLVDEIGTRCHFEKKVVVVWVGFWLTLCKWSNGLIPL